MSWPVKTCEVCNVALTLKAFRDIQRKRYCSKRCRQLARWRRGEMADSLKHAAAVSARRAKPPIKLKTCEECRSDYLPTSARQRWCSECCPSPRARALMQRYGLSWAKYCAILEKQETTCAICKIRPATVVDHDHQCCPDSNTCGQCVRGLLCNGCNLGLSTLETEGWLNSALQYLKDANRAVQKSISG